jgi:hypothetical protein
MQHAKALRQRDNGSAALALLLGVLASAGHPALAAQPAAPVRVVNEPITITGSVSAEISNDTLPVTGTVAVTGTPGVRLQLPSSSFFDEVELDANDAKAVGPGFGTFGVTSITITNLDADTQSLFLFDPVTSGSDCRRASIGGGGHPVVHLLVEGRKSTQLLYPTPLIFTRLGDQTCVAAEVTTPHIGAVVVAVNGIVE